MTAPAVAPSRSRRSTRIVIWATMAVVGTLLVGWLAIAKNPSLEPAGWSWQSADFVEEIQSESGSDEPATWVVWDRPDGAWASVVVTNDRPYAVTLSAGHQPNAVEVQLAPFDPDSDDTSINPDDIGGGQSLTVPGGGSAVVSMRVGYRCVDMAAHSSMGRDSAPVDVTTFGVTTGLEVPFPASYMAGPTTDYVADTSCPQG